MTFYTPPRAIGYIHEPSDVFPIREHAKQEFDTKERGLDYPSLAQN